MPLYATHRETTGERTAPTVLDYVAQLRGGGGLAHDAPVQTLAARRQQLAHLDRAIARRAFLVTGEQKGDRMVRMRMRRQKLLHRHHHGRQRGFHIGSSAAIQLAIAHRRGKWRALPLIQRSGGHDVGMAGKHEHGGIRLGTRAQGPKIGHAKVGRAALHRFADKAQRLQTVAQHLLTALVLRGDGMAGNQVMDQGLSGRHAEMGSARPRLQRGESRSRVISVNEGVSSSIASAGAVCLRSAESFSRRQSRLVGESA